MFKTIEEWTLKVYPLPCIEITSEERSTEIYEIIKNSIKNRIAYAAANLLMKGIQMGEYWLITDKSKQDIIENTLHYKEWQKIQEKEQKELSYLS